MERLTEREEYNHYIGKKGDAYTYSPIEFCGDSYVGEVINKLADYEDLGCTPEQLKQIDEWYAEMCRELGEYKRLEEQGLLLRLPCKVGDVVYFPKYDYHDSAIITQIEIEKEGITFYWVQYEYGVDITELWDDGCFSIDEIGKTVFLTREEAEQALAEMKGV